MKKILKVLLWIVGIIIGLFIIAIIFEPKQDDIAKEKLSQTQNQINIDKEKTNNFNLEYEVIGKYLHISKKYYFGDVLIHNLDEKMDLQLLKKKLIDISNREYLGSISFFTTTGALKATSSASYQKDYPNALKEGYLGNIENGEFFLYSDFKRFN